LSVYLVLKSHFQPWLVGFGWFGRLGSLVHCLDGLVGLLGLGWFVRWLGLVCWLVGGGRVALLVVILVFCLVVVGMMLVVVEVLWVVRM
jgi:hypothetical protein